MCTELNANLKRKKEKKDFGTIVNLWKSWMSLNCGWNYSQNTQSLLLNLYWHSASFFSPLPLVNYVKITLDISALYTQYCV